MIGGIVKTSLIDYPSHICAIICTQGCNYNCFYCHNRNLIPNGKKGTSIEEVLSFVKEREGFLDGIVISGGEPTLYKDLEQLLLKIKECGMDCKLDTNGSRPNTVRHLLQEKLIDYVALDIKGPRSRYTDFTSKEHMDTLVYQTLSYLIEEKALFEVRTTMAPTLTLEDLLVIAHELPPSIYWVLQRYRIPDEYRREDEALIFSPYITLDQEQYVLDQLRRIQPKVTLR